MSPRSQVSLTSPQFPSFFHHSLIATPSQIVDTSRQMFSGKGQAKLLLKSDKSLRQKRVISSALPIPSQSPLTSHTDNKRIVLSAGMGVCKKPV